VQFIKSRTGGLTFKNLRDKAWQLIDARAAAAVGRRRQGLGNALQFLIMRARHRRRLEKLGETVRARVKEMSGVELEWEIKRLGLPV
jgi:UDP-N-acetylmuramate dehydrogenase